VKLCTTLSVAYLVFVTIFLIEIIEPEAQLAYREPQSAAGRNENSTPRTFVLPATPAVAGQQERLQKLIDNEPTIKRCMLALFDEGYPIGNIEAIDNIHLFVSLIRFQRTSQIDVTGEFDFQTTDKLGC
jgi:hypothetical protein